MRLRKYCVVVIGKKKKRQKCVELCFVLSSGEDAVTVLGMSD